MFFLSQLEKEIPEIIKNDPAATRSYNELRQGIADAINLYIYDSGPYPEEKGVQILNFTDLAFWASKDWEALYPKFEKKRWLVIFIARGGFQLIDLIENKIDDFLWTYYKPKVTVREWEDESIFEEFTDPEIEDKFADFEGENVSLLLVDDIISTGENFEAVYDKALRIAEEFNVEIGEVAGLALISRLKSVGTIPIYGVLADIQIDIHCSWGNDLSDRIDYRDFSDLKDYCDEH